MIIESTMENLKIKIFADGANIDRIRLLSRVSYIKGFTTNPTLMRKSGINDYSEFAKLAIEAVGDKPISFEVFSDEHDEILRQALKISSWGSNVYVKVPICDTNGDLNLPIIRELTSRSVKVNVTAVMTLHQVESCTEVLDGSVPSFISIFAGRIADTGIDPVDIVVPALDRVKPFEKCEVIWASPREVLNLFQAQKIGCHVITVTDEILSKFSSIGHDLKVFSTETVKMFHRDAEESGFRI